MTIGRIIKATILSAAAALSACDGGDTPIEEIAASIAAEAKGAIAERGVLPKVSASLRIGGVSLEPTGAVLVEQGFCVFEDALASCDGAGNAWRRFDIRIDPANVDADAIGIDRVAPEWGNGLMVVLPCRNDSACIAKPDEPNQQRAPGDVINHGIASAAADMWAKMVVSSRHGTDNKIDPAAKTDLHKPLDPDYVRRFKAAAPETGPAAFPCPSQKACARLAKNAKRLIALASEGKGAVERASVVPDAVASVEPSADLTKLAKDIAADETRSHADTERKSAPKPLEPFDIDVMPKPGPRKNAKPGPATPAASTGAAEEILSRLNQRMRGKHYSGPLGKGADADALDFIVDKITVEPAFVVIRNVDCGLEPQRCRQAPFNKMSSPSTLRIAATAANATKLGMALPSEKAPSPYQAYMVYEGEFALELKPDWLLFYCVTLVDCQRNRDDLLALIDLAGTPGFVAPPSSRSDADRGGSVDEILARVNAAINGSYILFTAHFRKVLRGQYMAPTFLLKDGALASNGAGGALPYAIDLAKLGADSVGAPTQKDGGAEFRFSRCPLFDERCQMPSGESLFVHPGETFFVHLKAEGNLPFPQGEQKVLQGKYGISPYDGATGPTNNVKLTDITFECGTKAACEAFADDLRALIAAVKAARAYGVDIAGRWELYAPSPAGGFSRWILDFKRDGSYVFVDESNGASHAGRYHSSAGKWSLSGKWTKNPVLAPGTQFDDDGAYRLIAADALELKGRYGAGVWRKAADR